MYSRYELVNYATAVYIAEGTEVTRDPPPGNHISIKNKQTADPPMSPLYAWHCNSTDRPVVKGPTIDE